MNKIFTIGALKKDLPASVVVFLVALPLCLGIALASGAPLISGLIAGIVGGVVVGIISGSHTSVSGPAAGLAAIVLSAITELGTFETFLLAVALSGVLQIIMGIARAGIIANYFPTSVIKGLLAAIGVILILKQIPHALGYDKDNEGDFAFFQIDQENTFSELVNMLNYITPGAVIISIVSLTILIGWNKTRLKNTLVPSALVAVVAGILLNEFVFGSSPLLLLGTEHLVTLPRFDGVTGFFSSLTMPDWSQFGNSKVYVVAFTLAIVASIEALLNLEAVDKLDPHKRYSPPNRELIAQGIGNTLSGLVGGMPVTSVIVRSSANINAGAKTKMSAIIHGILLFAFVVAFPNLLNKIPLSSLAAILLVTGYKLASIKVAREMWAKGLNQFIPFAATVVAIVFTDLLIGIAIGLAVGMFYVLKYNMKLPFHYQREKHHDREVIRIKLAQEVSFLNRASVLTTLDKAQPGTDMILDASATEYIDHDVMEIIREFRDVKAPERNIKLSMIGFKDLYQLDDVVQHVNVLTKETQSKLTPDDVLEILKAGNERFVKNERIERDLLLQVSRTSMTQHPMAAVLGCIDSRATSELIFDLGLGDIFNARVAGNVSNQDIVGSLEFATKVSGAKLIVVLGHTNCGAIKAACDGVELGNITPLLHKVKPAIEKETETKGERNSKNDMFVYNVTHLNVKESMDAIRSSSPIISEMLAKGEIGMAGGVYDLATGRVEFRYFNDEWKQSAEKNKESELVVS